MTRSRTNRRKLYRHARSVCPVCNADRGDVRAAIKASLPLPDADSKDGPSREKVIASCVRAFEAVRDYLLHGEA